MKNQMFIFKEGCDQTFHMHFILMPILLYISRYRRTLIHCNQQPTFTPIQNKIDVRRYIDEVLPAYI